jgi:hypothetical protein
MFEAPSKYDPAEIPHPDGKMVESEAEHGAYHGKSEEIRKQLHEWGG